MSNTTPISNLVRIGRLELLRAIFGKVLIPAQVADELDRGESIIGAWREAPGADGVEIAHPLDGPFLRQLQVQLDAGEAAAIALAAERGAALLLIDEQDGRRTATLHGLPLSGTLGVLIEAKRVDLIAEVRPLLDALESIHFRIGAELRARVLRAADETDETGGS